MINQETKLAIVISGSGRDGRSGVQQVPGPGVPPGLPPPVHAVPFAGGVAGGGRGRSAVADVALDGAADATGDAGRGRSGTGAAPGGRRAAPPATTAAAGRCGGRRPGGRQPLSGLLAHQCGHVELPGRRLGLNVRHGHVRVD